MVKMYTLMICSMLYLIYTTLAHDINDTYTELNDILVTNINVNFNQSIIVTKETKENINQALIKNENGIKERNEKGIEINEKIFIITNSTTLNETYKGDERLADEDDKEDLEKNIINYDDVNIDDNEIFEYLTTSKYVINLNSSNNFSDYHISYNNNSNNNTGNFNKTFQLMNENDDVNLIINISDYVDNSNDDDDDDVNDTISDDDYLDQIRDFIFPKTWAWVLIFFHSIVFVIGLVGNTLVCVAVYRNHTMRTVTNYFIVNLAVADFLVILFCLPPSVIWDVTMTWFFGIAMCKIVLYLQVR